MDRDFERDIIPMARSEGDHILPPFCTERRGSRNATPFTGMALALWNVLAGGKFRTDAEEEQRRVTGEHGRKEFWNSNSMSVGSERTENERRVSVSLEKVANEIGAKSITAGKCG